MFKKRIKEFETGQPLIDLTEGTLNTTLQVEVDNIIIVSKAFAGKPTAIAYSVYGSENFADLLFAFNGYSNMFRVNAGDILVIPSLESMISCLNDPEDITSVNDLKNRSEDNFTLNEFKKKIITRDINRLKVIADNTGIDIGKLDIRKPNMATNDPFKKIDVGISLGTNITTTEAKTLVPVLSKSDMIKEAAKKTLISNFANDAATYVPKNTVD